jgi:1-deoxy-D-xylulose-5-phosphate reductoisomerase
MSPRRIAILGATGSVGESTLDVIARHPARFVVGALTAHGQWEKLAQLCRIHRPEIAVLAKPEAASELEHALTREGVRTRVLAGEAGLVEAATSSAIDIVVAAIVGAAGLRSTLAAAAHGKRILLANKEALVIGGAAFMRAVEAGGATLLPIDSEHNAIFQCLPQAYARRPAESGVRRILLTASGGPLRTRPLAELPLVTADEACAHPNWVMGRKISVDSATMMNKGLEMIEAHWLFGVPRERIEIVVHPESVIHSLVDYVDGSVLAQLGHPDMRTPIAQALAFPDRVDTGVAELDLVQLGLLNFSAPDHERFPCLKLAAAALDAGGTAPAILNAANEVAVAAFLASSIRYTDIAPACTEALARLPARAVDCIDDAIAADVEARAVTRSWLKLPNVA